MYWKSLRTLVLAGVAFCGLAGAVEGSDRQRTVSLPPERMTMAPAFTPVTGQARGPSGWLGFCERYAGECDGDSPPGAPVRFEGGERDLIVSVNNAVNREISPRTDMENWGVSERWDYPDTGFGDCEDYVLLKRRRLMEAGLPRSALLVTVVTDLAGDGHAVLTVRTDRGDYILDNMEDEVKLWRETPYGFVKRQSERDQRAWVALGSTAPAPMTASK